MHSDSPLRNNSVNFNRLFRLFFSPFITLRTVIESNILHEIKPCLKMLVVSHLVKKPSTFYETPKLITAFTKFRHFSVSWASCIQSTPKYHFVKISFVIIFQCTPRSSKLFNLFRFFHRNWMLPCYSQSGTHSPPIWSWNFDHSNSVGGGGVTNREAPSLSNYL